MLFCWALLLNVLTPYVADDYSYMYDFSTGERLRDMGQIVPSMIAHAHTMNGRIWAHGLEQFFLLLPGTVFDAVNAAVCTAYLLLICRVCGPGRRRCSLLLAVSAAVWLHTPAYGEVFLWQDGAINYLWGLTAELLFLLPFVTLWRDGRSTFRRAWTWGPFALFSYLMGTWSEATAFSAVFTGAVFLAASWRRDRTRTIGPLVSLIAAALGFLTLFAMPAESGKAAVSLLRPVLNLADLGSVLAEEALPLFAAWPLLAVCALALHADQRTTAASALLFVSSLASAGVLIAGSYSPDRCLCACSTLLTAACGTLLPDVGARALSVLRRTLPEERPRALAGAAALSAALIASLFALSALRGTYDVWECSRQYAAREERIEELVRDGETDIVVDALVTRSKYQVAHTLIDLLRDPDQWPNTDVARYYGLSSIAARLSDQRPGQIR